LSVTSSNSWGKIARYVGKYISKHIGQRLPEDKGARLVRYSKETNRVGTRFSWVSSGAYMWRAKLGTFCRSLNLNSDNYKAFLKEWFGRNWVYHLRPLIQAIKLPEFYPANESSESIRAVWLTAINERERLKPLKRRPKGCARLTRYVQPALTRALRMLVSETGRPSLGQGVPFMRT
jgi:hypothetical protein